MPALRTALLALSLTTALFAQTSTQPATPAAAPSTTPAAPPPPPPQNAPSPLPPTRFDVLRGAYGPFRANNDLLSYHLDIRVDPVAKTIAGKNTVRFKMLEDGNRIQLDLTDGLAIDKILLGATPLTYTRDTGAVFIDFPETLHAGETYAIDFYYSGAPRSKGRFGGMSYETDPAGRPWIFTADEDDGCSIWWPCKDQWRDEPQEGMDISVAVPDGLTDVSNGRFVSKVNLHDGYTQWNWHVSYPINSYDVALNIAAYTHFSETYTSKLYAPLAMDFYVLPEDLDKAKAQFPQAKDMLNAFEHYFGEYPFARDGYKLIEVPYSGMEHQTAVSYGNHFVNGYFGDWTGVGISTKFDFIIIHESGHEWFGNAITAADRSDMWIHEGWDTYLEALFVEYQYGHDAALTYLNGKPGNKWVPGTPHHWNGVQSHIATHDRRPIITERGVNGDPPQDMYFKGAMMLNTLRSVIADDLTWFSDIKAFYQAFKYKNTMTEEVVAWWNQRTGRDLTPFFNQYLRHVEIPTLELNFDEAHNTVMYKWQATEPGFTMPVQVGDPAHWQTITPTQEWQTMSSPIARDDFQVATDLYYIHVSKT
jgi:aminopeptidase N